MGKKHAKKRFFCVKYIIKPDKKFDEFVELSKKKIGPGKMLEYTVVLDLVNEEIIIDPIDYYYSNAIARASKTMFECRNEKIKLKSTGTEG